MKIYVNAPGTPFCLSSTVFFRGEVFTEHCPYRVADMNGVDYDTQWDLVSETSTGILVEISADITTAFLGNVVFTLVPGDTLKMRPDISRELLPLLTECALKVTLQDDTFFRVPLKFNLRHRSRSGAARITLKKHVAHPFGGVHAWLDIKCNSDTYGLTLNFHNQLNPAKGKFYFKAVELYLPDGFEFVEGLGYGTKHGRFLFGPENHMIPQRRALSRRLQIVKTGVTPVSLIWGQGISNFFTGGMLPADYAIGHLQNSQGRLNGEVATVHNKFINALPELNNGQAQPHRLWQSMESQYGGMTGGTDIEQIPDPEIADSKDAWGLVMLMEKQLRYHNRQTGPILESDGYHVQVEDYMNANGTLPWSMFANQFQVSGGKPKEGPFLFSKAAPNFGSCDYEGVLLAWMPLDHQHLRRLTKHDQLLVWLMNDPLSKQYCIETAELQRMAYWTGPGGRFDINQIGLGQGMDVGREYAWMLDAVTFAACLADTRPEHKANLKSWCVTVTAYALKAQLRTGWINVKRGGKVVTDAPFSSQYYGGQAFESCFVAHALLGVWKGIGVSIAQEALRNLLRAFWDYAWDHSKAGPQYKTPTHYKDASGAFQELATCPSLDPKLETFNLGTLAGMAWEVLEAEPDCGLRPDLMFMAHQSSTTMPAAITKAVSSTATSAHLANSIGIAQRVVLGVQE